MHTVRPFRNFGVCEIQDRVGQGIDFFFQYPVFAEKHIVKRGTVRRAAHHQTGRPAEAHRIVHAMEP